MNNAQNNILINTGIVMKLENDKALVMTDKLDFMELKLKPGMKRGQKVMFDKSDLYEADFFTKYRNAIRSISALTAAAAIFLVMFFSVRFTSLPQEYAYVALDINPSLELVIDKNKSVIDAKALNNDARTIISEANPKGLLIDEALSGILNKSKEKGFINSSDSVVLFSASLSSKQKKDVSYSNNSVQELLDSFKVIAESAGIKSEIVASTPEDREKAFDQGLSMGRYAVYTKAKSEGISIDIDEVKTSSISEIFNKINNWESITSNNAKTPEATPAATVTVLASSTPQLTPTSEPNFESTTTPMVTPTTTPVIIPTLSAATPAPTITRFVIPTPTTTTTPSPSPSPSPSPTVIYTVTPAVPTPTATTPAPTITRFVIPTSTATTTPSPSPSPSPSPTVIYTVTPVVPTPTATTPAPTITRIVIPTPTVTATPSPSPSPSPTVIYTITPAVPTPTATTPAPTVSPTIIATPTPTVTATPTTTPTPTNTIMTTPTPTLLSTITPIVSPSPSPTATFTATPSPTPIVTPTAPSPTETTLITSVELLAYNHNRTSEAKELQPRIKLINTGDAPINLADVKIRYYYTKDSVINQAYTCDWSNISASRITGTLAEMSSIKPNADSYLEIGFISDAGILMPNQNVEIVNRFGNGYVLSLATPPYSEWNYMYNQDSDYSYNSISSDFVVYDKITVYISGALYWGIEP